jgi:outer membrane protein assembly factor BamB
MACSPLVEGDRLWFVTNRAEVVCLDIGPLHRGTGEPTVVWKIDLMAKFDVYPRGSVRLYAHLCSIAGYRDFIYVNTGNGVDQSFVAVPKPDAPSLICFRKATGETVWTDASPGANILYGQWSSPTVIESGGRVQCVAAQGDGWVRSFDALSGELLWRFDMNRKESVYFPGGRGLRNTLLASPVFHDDRIYIAGGQHPEQGEGLGRLVCLDPTRRGDISAESALDGAGNILPHRRTQAVDTARGERAVINANSGLVWEFTQCGPEFEQTMHRTTAGTTVHDGLVIAVDFSGLVHCLDVKTGKRHWVWDVKAAIYSSPLVVDGKVYVGDDEGKVTVLGLSADPNRALPGGEPLAVIVMDNSVYCSPVFANGVLYLAPGYNGRLYAVAAGAEKADP